MGDLGFVADSIRKPIEPEDETTQAIAFPGA